MRRLAPYQTGLWLAEYLDIRCQLCRFHRSTPQAELCLSPSLTDDSNLLRENTSPPSSDYYPNSHRLGSGLLCTHCHKSLCWLPKPFEVDVTSETSLLIQAATYYDYPIRQAIQAFKHHEDMTKLPLLLHVIRQLPRPHGCHHNNSVIVAMPTTEPRLIKRGFDPVSILSAQLSKHWHIPLWQGVNRIDDTVSQQGLSRAERLNNLDNAFSLSKNLSVKRLLLFDDVSTTGASLQALARTFISPHLNTYVETQKSLSNYYILAYALAHGSQ